MSQKLWMHFHPDRILYIRDGENEDSAVKAFTNLHPIVQNFPLPSGVRQIEYYEGKAFCYDRFNNQLELEVDNSIYEAIFQVALQQTS